MFLNRRPMVGRLQRRRSGPCCGDSCLFPSLFLTATTARASLTGSIRRQAHVPLVARAARAESRADAAQAEARLGRQRSWPTISRRSAAADATTTRSASKTPSDRRDPLLLLHRLHRHLRRRACPDLGRRAQRLRVTQGEARSNDDTKATCHRRFCKDCGCHMFLYVDGFPDFVLVHVPTVDRECDVGTLPDAGSSPRPSIPW